MGAYTDSCSCEHVRHFSLEENDMFPEVPRDGHEYGDAPAAPELGETIVGSVCTWCAEHCGVFEASASWRAALGWTSRECASCSHPHERYDDCDYAVGQGECTCTKFACPDCAAQTDGGLCPDHDAQADAENAAVWSTANDAYRGE